MALIITGLSRWSVVVVGVGLLPMSAITPVKKKGHVVTGRKVVFRAKTNRTQNQAAMARTREVDPMILPLGLNVDFYGNVEIDYRYRQMLLE